MNRALRSLARLPHALVPNVSRPLDGWVADGGYVYAAGFLAACLGLLVARRTGVDEDEYEW
jgi:hypothetical protein